MHFGSNSLLFLGLLTSGVLLLLPHPGRSSAIPMWEFLTRTEKMSHLYNMFVKQVSDFCDTSTMPDCEKVLLVYGIRNLAKMKEDSLDKMDPYQRGAPNIIWDSMMHGTYKQKTPPTQSSHYDPQTSDNQVVDEGYLVAGGMLVRVLPDGSPVPEDSTRRLPEDFDKQELESMRSHTNFTQQSTT